MERDEFDAAIAAMSFKAVHEEDRGVRYLRLIKGCWKCGGHQHIPAPRIQEDLTNAEVLDFVMREIRARDCGHGLPPAAAGA